MLFELMEMISMRSPVPFQLAALPPKFILRKVSGLTFQGDEFYLLAGHHAIQRRPVMNLGTKRARQLAFNASSTSRDTICVTCFNRLSQQARQYAAVAAAAVSEAPSQDQSSTAQDLPPVKDQAPRKAYRLLIAPVLSRPPLLTQELTSFEKAFFLYQKRLNERLALPLTRYFYYKKGTPADLEWKRKLKSRLTPARDIGVYNAYAKEGWNDEVLVGDQNAEPEHVMEALIRDEEGKDIIEAQPVGDKDTEGEAIAGDARIGEGVRKDLHTDRERPVSRTTVADKANDTKSLSRKLDRSLYLLVKSKSGKWRFPEDRLVGKETLYQAAERIIVQSAGVNMNTWVVGNHPVGHYHVEFGNPRRTKVVRHLQDKPEPKTYELEEYGEKVFFMKTRLMAGQADLAKNLHGATDFGWWTKEEIEDKVAPPYWSAIRNMLTER